MITKIIVKYVRSNNTLDFMTEYVGNDMNHLFFEPTRQIGDNLANLVFAQTIGDTLYVTYCLLPD